MGGSLVAKIKGKVEKMGGSLVKGERMLKEAKEEKEGVATNGEDSSRIIGDSSSSKEVGIEITNGDNSGNKEGQEDLELSLQRWHHFKRIRLTLKWHKLNDRNRSPSMRSSKLNKGNKRA